MLGVNITDNYDSFNGRVAHKVDLFFDMVDRLDLHPEATHKILHFCGDPKLLFYASTTPPCFSGAVLARFAERATASFAKLIDSDVADIDRTSLHRRNGAAIPDYCSNAQRLYDASLATMMDSRPTLVGLFTPSSPPGVIADPDSADATVVGRLEEAEYDAYWTHWTYSSQHVKLTPAEFRIALAARVGTIPRFVYDKEAIRCDCGELCTSAPTIISHASRCFRLSGISEAVRYTCSGFRVVEWKCSSDFPLQCSSHHHLRAWRDCAS